jgi:hypothetical protein
VPVTDIMRGALSQLQKGTCLTDRCEIAHSGLSMSAVCLKRIGKLH